MMLRLIAGRAGSGKSRLCLEEINSRLREDPFSWPLIYLIPEQASFQAEYSLAATSPQGGSIRAQALRFKRLAWKVMQETGGGQRLFIDDTGKSMLLLRILEKNKKQLRLFKYAGEQPGTLENLLRLYNEMKRYCCTSSRLQGLLRGRGEKLPLLLRDKLADLLILMEEMEQEMEGHYQDGEDTLGTLIEKMPLSSYLQDAEIWVDGFYHFTRLELQVLEALMKTSRAVTVTLCLDRDYLPGEKLSLMNPFYAAAFTCQAIQQLAFTSGITVQKIFLPGERRTRFSGNDILSHLEKYLTAFPVIPYPAQTGRQDGVFPLTLGSAPNRRSEVESVARKIIHLARDHAYRWKDVAVLINNLEDYRDLVTTVFQDYDIPFFLDQERPASFHPLVEFIRSAVEVVTRGWRYDSVFRCIKTAFLYPLPDGEKVDREWRKRASRLENYVLALGIQGNRWLEEEPWNYSVKDALDEEPAPEKDEKGVEELLQQEINETRRLLSAPLERFRQALKKASTVREKTSALFSFLEDVSAGKRLEIWSREALQKGDLEQSREHLQVYNSTIHLLEQLVEMMGDTPVSAAQFSRILEAGLDNLPLSLVPPSLDRVMVGNLERTRPGDVKCVFILGANDGILPARLQEEGVFTEDERDSLEKYGLELAPGVKKRLLEQQFLIYMAMTRAADRLWISYPRADEDGRALMPSLLIGRLKELFPFLQEQLLKDEPEENMKETDVGRQEEVIFSFLVHPRKTLSLLSAELSRWKGGAPINSLWWDIYNWYVTSEQWRNESSRILKGLFYRNSEPPLGKEMSRRLYGKHWKASVSRLERFRACPFSQFISHGLRLHERKLYRLESLDIGRFFHLALRNVTLSFLEKKVDFAHLDEKVCLELVEEEVEKLVPRLQKEILLSSSRFRYLASRLKKTVGMAVLQMVDHYRKSLFRPVGVELSFGPGGELPSPNLDLENGWRVEIVGRIDRVDLARDGEGKAYLRVIDYKSGAANLNLAEVYHGLSLQLLFYLDIILSSSVQWLKETAFPAGVFYFRIHAPFINAQSRLPAGELARELQKSYRLKGRSLADPEVIRLMDKSLVSGHSTVIPVHLNKDGTLGKNSPVFSSEQFNHLREHVRLMFRHTARGISAGLVDIYPYKMGKKRACTYCPYKAVCQFDPCLEENLYRQLPPLGEEDIWEKLKRKT